MTEPRQDENGLVAPEGVDEGSAAGTAEAGPDRDDAVLGAPPHGAPVAGEQAAAPVDTDSAPSRAARDQAPGQQLAAGEG